MIPGVAHRRQFRNLSEQEVLALAISSEEDDGRIYRWYAQRLRADFPQSALIFEEMANEEDEHRATLTEEHRRRFGDTIPLIRREHVAGFYHRRPVWLIQNLGPDRIREEATRMEIEARDFYLRAAQRTTDAGTRQLLNRLSAAESGHEKTSERLLREHLPPDAKAVEDAEAHRQFVLTWVQPGLAGLMDGSVSTLAPIFAAAFATGDTSKTFLVGLAASVGAGISMGFTEAASDDGTISGRGSPGKRGIASGAPNRDSTDRSHKRMTGQPGSTQNRPSRTRRGVTSSVSARWPLATSAAASVDFPAPDGPMNATAPSSTTTQLAWRQMWPRRRSTKPSTGPSR